MVKARLGLPADMSVLAEYDALLFAFLSALTWGVAPIFAKRGTESGVSPLQGTVIVILLNNVIYWPAVFVFSGPAGPFAGLTLGDVGVFVAGGIVGTTMGRIVNYEGVHRVGASVNSAIIGSQPFFATLLAIAFLGESVSMLLFVGIAGIVVGGGIISVSKGGDIKGWKSWELLFPLGAATAYAGGSVIRRFGFTATPASVLEALTINETAAIVALGTYIWTARRGELRGAVSLPSAQFVISGGFSAIGLFALFEALSRGPVSIVVPITATSPLFTTLFTYLALRRVERVTRGVVVGAVLIVFGAGLIASL